MTPDETRAEGPSTVREGPDDAPTVLVLDPAGEAKHDRVPATWRPLTEQLRLVWCRLPASVRQGDTGHELAREFREAPTGLHLVAGGAAARPALTLAMGCAQWVRSVVLVDPPHADDPELRVLADELGALHVPVQLVLTTSDHDAPLPLGHPEVVAAVVQTLVAVETEASAVRTPDTRPPQRSLVVEALDAVLHAVRAALTP